MKVLVACEFSGRVREAFRAKGHDAWSCDLLESLDDSDHHIKGDISGILGMHWDLIIAHPPCTYLTVAGNSSYANRPDLYIPAAEFAMQFFRYAPRVCVENPVGRLSSLFRRPDQTVQPYDFGDDASKRTCLWLQGLPRLLSDPDKRIPGRLVESPPGSGRLVERWANQTDSGQNNLGPSPDRSALRSVTYMGIAQAMADQWG